jgi:dienelactone hydrolase
LAHGFGATHDMMLPQYEKHFAAAGIATFAFDYRNTGDSDGQPRQHISLRRQRADVEAALDFVARQPAVDATRMGLWGTSLGGMNVLRVAAGRDDVRAAVVQCPMVHGPAAVRTLGAMHALRLAPLIAEDTLRASLRRGRRYVAIVGPPGSTAVVTAEGAAEGWNSTVPPGRALREPRCRRRRRRPAVEFRAAARAQDRRAATGMRVRPRNPDRPQIRWAGRDAAPRGEARHYDSDHFEIYHPPLVAQALADQTAFLREHLDVRA